MFDLNITSEDLNYYRSERNMLILACNYNYLMKSIGNSSYGIKQHQHQKFGLHPLERSDTTVSDIIASTTVADHFCRILSGEEIDVIEDDRADKIILACETYFKRGSNKNNNSNVMQLNCIEKRKLIGAMLGKIRHETFALLKVDENFDLANVIISQQKLAFDIFNANAKSDLRIFNVLTNNLDKISREFDPPLNGSIERILEQLLFICNGDVNADIKSFILKKESTKDRLTNVSYELSSNVTNEVSNNKYFSSNGFPEYDTTLLDIKKVISVYEGATNIILNNNMSVSDALFVEHKSAYKVLAMHAYSKHAELVLTKTMLSKILGQYAKLLPGSKGYPETKKFDKNYFDGFTNYIIDVVTLCLTKTSGKLYGELSSLKAILIQIRGLLFKKTGINILRKEYRRMVDIVKRILILYAAEISEGKLIDTYNKKRGVSDKEMHKTYDKFFNRKHNLNEAKINNGFHGHLPPQVALMQILLLNNIGDLLTALKFSTDKSIFRYDALLGVYDALRYYKRSFNCNKQYSSGMEENYFYYFAASFTGLIYNIKKDTNIEHYGKIYNILWYFSQCKRPHGYQDYDSMFSARKKHFDAVYNHLVEDEWVDKSGFNLANNLLAIFECKTNEYYAGVQQNTPCLSDEYLQNYSTICATQPVTWCSTMSTQFDNLNMSFRVSLKISEIYTKIYTYILLMYKDVVNRKIPPDTARNEVSKILPFTLFLKKNMTELFVRDVEKSNDFLCEIFSTTLYEMELKCASNTMTMIENTFKLIASSFLNGPFNESFQLLTYKGAIQSYRQAKKHNRP